MVRYLLAFLVLAGASLGGAGHAQTLRIVMHSDLKSVDPTWSGTYISRNHGYMVFDTLFAVDENFQIKPQMVDNWSTSEDGLTWTFKLREGLEWHDGTPVTAEDCIASLKRWAQLDIMGRKLTQFIAEYKALDDRSFQLVLKEKYGLVLESLGKPSVGVPFMMPKHTAETEAAKQIDDPIGSGPFIFKKDEWRPGAKVVYVKNSKYKPRAEPMSGMAGGKVVTLERVEWVWLPDPETQLDALIKGEIDAIESVTHDHIPLLEAEKDIRLVPRTIAQNQYAFRMNWLTPPFDNIKVRQAVTYALSQEDFLKANIGDPRFYRTCKALFTCNSPYESTTGMDGLLEGNSAKARQLLAEAGYDGTPIVLLQPYDLVTMRQLAPVAKAQLERAGFKVDLQAMDWQSMVSRIINKKGPPSEGGWNAFGTSWSRVDILDPLMTGYLAANCAGAYAGWPCDEEMEMLRDKYARASEPAERKAIAEEVQAYAMKIVTHVPLGEWFSLLAVRSNIGLPKVFPPVTAFWGVTKN
jgi:peptide/nickel transport system substrate-binding protein